MSMIKQIEIDGKQVPFKASCCHSENLPYEVPERYLQGPEGIGKIHWR